MTWESPKMSLSQLFVRFWAKEETERYQAPASYPVEPCKLWMGVLECSIPLLRVDTDSRVREPSKRQRSNTGRRSGKARGGSPGGEGRASHISEKQPGVPAARSLTPGLRLHSSPLQPPTPLGAS